LKFEVNRGTLKPRRRLYKKAKNSSHTYPTVRWENAEEL
jgi:hypothetical protein